MNKVLISVLGPDRPGIIATVSKVLFEQDCNIENVSQTILQAEFSGIFIASIPADMTPAALTGRLKGCLASMGLHVFVMQLEQRPTFAEAVACEPFVITTIGPDRKGLVAGITAVIAKHNVNVTNLQAVFKGGDDPSDNVMIYEVDVPLQTDREALRQELKAKASELQLDLSIQHRDIFKALNRI